MNKTIQHVHHLTPAQAGILFHTLDAPGSGQYVVQIALTLSGEIEPQREQTAWAALIARHDALRTAFVWEGQKQPLQVVGVTAKPSVTVEDLSADDKASQDAAIQSYCEADRTQGFDLRKAPLLRVHRFDLGHGQHHLIITFHHIVLDGWSIPLLLRDWISLYVGRALPPASNFKDYLGWLHHQDRSAALDFWRAELAGLEDAPHIPLPAPTTRNTPLGTCILALPEALTKRLQDFAGSHRLTVSTLVHGLWALVLARYQDRADVIYGLTRSGRPATLPGAHERVGMFINTLPMHAKIDNSSQLLDWLSNLQRTKLVQQPHEHAAPVDVHAVSPVPQGAPLMQSVVVFENYPTDPDLLGQMDGLNINTVDIAEQTNFPLALFAQLGRVFELKLLFDGKTICPDAARRMLMHLQNLFEALVESPDCAISDLPLLQKEETTHLLKLGQPKPVERSPVSISQSIADQPPDALAIDGETPVTYGPLNAQANQIANDLIANGVTKGEAVGVCLPRSARVPAALLGIMRAGAAYVPLDPTYPLARLQHIADDSGVQTILCQSDTAQICADLDKTTLHLDNERGNPSEQPPQIDITDDDPAYLIYTSGSTGSPKGVPIHHGALKNLLSSFQTRLGLNANHTWMAVTTLSFDIATLEMILPLSVGATLVIATDEEVGDPVRMGARISRHSITHMQATPSAWRLLVESGWSGASLTALCGGEALDTALAKILLDRVSALWNVYGPTETTIWSTALRLTPEYLAGGTVPIGGTLDNTSLSVRDSLGRLMPFGMPGELCIGGAGLSKGYHQRNDLTADRFVTSDTEQRFYRTGDRARWRNDGMLDFLGRIDTQTKLRGHRIEIGEVESALARHGAVDQAVAVVTGKGSEARLIACIRQSGPVSDQELRTHLAGMLPAYMLPNSYMRHDQFPQTLNGKIDRTALVAQAVARRTPVMTPQNLDEPMATLASIWRDLLQQDRITPQDSFFDLGGHSLLIVTLQDRIRSELNQQLDITDLFRFPTLQAQADHIAQLQGHVHDTSAADPIETRTQARVTGKDRLRQRRAARAKQRSEHV